MANTSSRIVIPLTGGTEGAGRVAKVLLQGTLESHPAAEVRFDKSGHGEAVFNLARRPTNLRVLVGPHDASDEELAALQTLSFEIPVHSWKEPAELRLNPYPIPPYWWDRWRYWCREFTISGRVVCADQSPVPGATVCAYDVDWVWFWSSTQQIACATTDLNGVFHMSFRWCCGWWWWWWWPLRYWMFEPALAARIQAVLDPDVFRRLGPAATPSLDKFADLLGAKAAILSTQTIDPPAIAALGAQLRDVLPPSRELEEFRIWPWYPWERSWNDCNPDIIFKVTQNCLGAGNTVIVNESVSQTRWNIPPTLNNVTLIANESACCVRGGVTPCIDTECLLFTTVCGATIDSIAGNPGNASMNPLLTGLHAPGGPSDYSDQPFAENVPIAGTSDCMVGIDYYEFVYATTSGGPMNPMPPAADGTVHVTYVQQNLLFPFEITWVRPPLGPHFKNGRNVYETRLHWEAANPPPPNHLRIPAQDRDLLINWQTQAGGFADATYYLQVIGYNVDGGGNLINPRTVNLCAGSAQTSLVLTLDNRLETSGPTDLHGMPCGGGGTTHLCTEEPCTEIFNVAIERSGTIINVGGCGAAALQPDDQLLIDFVVYDAAGHLANYGLELHYDVNLVRDLLNPGLVPSGTLSAAGPGWSGVPIADFPGPDYLSALSLGQGAKRPNWRGGVLRYRALASECFPETCCYLLHLQAWKRTINTCTTTHSNISEQTFTITV